ncbi:hypothetical protein HK099_004590 [Clydaea vesicula]|uniref:Transmembrane protein n=1 Tax=Clydaea vesicula TaxID=447962 RepID=A0AAD5U6R5_9FUNG|nr:hypothetical protein HK099_004590 [Clydaea vesicula]
MSTYRFCKIQILNRQSTQRYVIDGIKYTYFTSSIIMMLYLIFEFVSANITSYPIELLKIQSQIFSVSFFLVAACAMVTDFILSCVMIKTVITSLDESNSDGVEKRIKFKLAFLLVISIGLEIFSGILFIKEGQVVSIKFLATMPTYIHLILTSMLLEILSTSNEIVKKAQRNRISKKSNLTENEKFPAKSTPSSFLSVNYNRTGENKTSSLIPEVIMIESQNY